MPCRGFNFNFYKKNIWAFPGVSHFSNKCSSTVYAKSVLGLLGQLFLKMMLGKTCLNGGTKKCQGGWCHDTYGELPLSIQVTNIPTLCTAFWMKLWVILEVQTILLIFQKRHQDQWELNISFLFYIKCSFNILDRITAITQIQFNMGIVSLTPHLYTVKLNYTLHFNFFWYSDNIAIFWVILDKFENCVYEDQLKLNFIFSLNGNFFFLRKV